MRPSAHLLQLKNPRDKWSWRDHVIAEAYRTLESLIDEETGLPRWWTHNPSDDIGFKVNKGINYGKAELVRVQEKRGKNQQLKPGEYDTVEAFTYSGKPLPTYEQYIGVELVD